MRKPSQLDSRGKKTCRQSEWDCEEGRSEREEGRSERRGRVEFFQCDGLTGLQLSVTEREH